MNEEHPAKIRLAESFIQQRRPEIRKKLIIKNLIVFGLLFLAHSFSSNLETPLKLIPQTMSAVGMGYVLFILVAIKQFSLVVDFIDWEKVESHTEQSP